jgi:hypothetical protein
VLVARLAADAGEHEDRRRAGLGAALDIARPVAHHKAARQIQAILARRVAQELRIRFAAVALVFRMVWANVVAFDVGAGGGEMLVEQGMDFLDRLACEVAATDAGLIRHHKEPKPGVLQTPQGLRRAGDQLHLIDVADVIGIPHQHAVAIQKNSPVIHRAGILAVRGHCRQASVSRSANDGARSRPGGPLNRVNNSPEAASNRHDERKAIVKTNLLLAVALATLWAVIPARAYPTYTASVEIRRVSDFYVPLATTGYWVEIGPYGWCWYPAYVDRSWRPYSSGNWVWCDEGWYWDSDEPWAWATYHYGGWVWDRYYGWVWVPDVVWAPSWVSWREGGGYVGWAPQPPVTQVVVVEPQYFVFVEQQHFCRPIQPSILVVNPTVINQTVNITNLGRGSQAMFNQGPRERANPGRVVKAPVVRPSPATVPPSRPAQQDNGWAQRPAPQVDRTLQRNSSANAGPGKAHRQAKWEASQPPVTVMSEPGRMLKHRDRDDDLGTLAAQGR